MLEKNWRAWASFQVDFHPLGKTKLQIAWTPQREAELALCG